MKALVLVLLAAAAGACSKKEPPHEARTEPWENPAYLSSAQPAPQGSAAPGTTQRYTLQSSKVSFELRAKQQTTRGSLQAVSGTLEVAPDLVSSRANLEFDLTSLGVTSDGDAGDHEAYTRRALEWLELGEQVPASTRERHRRATFELSGLERLTEGKKAGSWTGFARGQLALHGFRVPIAQAVSFDFSPEQVVVRSSGALIKLAEHDLRPRNAEGQVVATELPLLGTRIGREAKVELELVFVAAAPGQKSESE
jgi:hypothetical protein